MLHRPYNQAYVTFNESKLDEYIALRETNLTVLLPRLLQQKKDEYAARRSALEDAECRLSKAECLALWFKEGMRPTYEACLAAKRLYEAKQAEHDNAEYKYDADRRIFKPALLQEANEKKKAYDRAKAEYKASKSRLSNQHATLAAKPEEDVSAFLELERMKQGTSSTFIAKVDEYFKLTAYHTASRLELENARAGATSFEQYVALRDASIAFKSPPRERNYYYYYRFPQLAVDNENLKRVLAEYRMYCNKTSLLLGADNPLASKHASGATSTFLAVNRAAEAAEADRRFAKAATVSQDTDRLIEASLFAKTTPVDKLAQLAQLQQYVMGRLNEHKYDEDPSRKEHARQFTFFLVKLINKLKPTSILQKRKTRAGARGRAQRSTRRRRRTRTRR